MPGTTTYDDTNPESIRQYAQGLIGHPLKEKTLIPLNDVDVKNKGSFGTILEEFYFRYQQNSDMEADFPNAGVELKSSPLKRLLHKPSQ